RTWSTSERRQRRQPRVMGAQSALLRRRSTTDCLLVGLRGPGGGVARDLVAAADVLDLALVGEPDVGDAPALGVPDLLAELLRARRHLGGDPAASQRRGNLLAGG